mmetsp:Transcript_18777/g.57767  ORF Transcript_18777/g.57767 Transcript_18777/m.57767 type:complete len:226 (+) Transcript_18777:1502-2179(+)
MNNRNKREQQHERRKETTTRGRTPNDNARLLTTTTSNLEEAGGAEVEGVGQQVGALGAEDGGAEAEEVVVVESAEVVGVDGAAGGRVGGGVGDDVVDGGEALGGERNGGLGLELVGVGREVANAFRQRVGDVVGVGPPEQPALVVDQDVAPHPDLGDDARGFQNVAREGRDQPLNLQSRFRVRAGPPLLVGARARGEVLGEVRGVGHRPHQIVQALVDDGLLLLL